MSGDIYNFIDARTEIQSIVHLINLKGQDTVGAIVGINRGDAYCSILQNCPFLLKLYGIESWNSKKDVSKLDNLELPTHDMTEAEMEYTRLTAFHNIKYSGFAEKSAIIEKFSQEAVNDIEDNSLDFIFLDTYLNYEQQLVDLESWYKKLKAQGIFAGTDWNWNPVKKVVFDFKSKINLKEQFSVFDNVWIWIKE